MTNHLEQTIAMYVPSIKQRGGRWYVCRCAFRKINYLCAYLCVVAEKMRLKLKSCEITSMVDDLLEKQGRGWGCRRGHVLYTPLNYYVSYIKEEFIFDRCYIVKHTKKIAPK